MAYIGTAASDDGGGGDDDDSLRRRILLNGVGIVRLFAFNIPSLRRKCLYLKRFYFNDF
jgi:hypothetical protein